MKVDVVPALRRLPRVEGVSLTPLLQLEAEDWHGAQLSESAWAAAPFPDKEEETNPKRIGCAGEAEAQLLASRLLQEPQRMQLARLQCCSIC